MKLFKKFFQIIWSFVRFFLCFQVALRLVKRYVKFPTPAFLGSVLDSNYRRFLQPPGIRYKNCWFPFLANLN